MKAKEYLFAGMENLNDGFDAESIVYVSEQDFETVLNRVEAKNIAIYGIEPWYEREFFDVRVYDFTDYEADDPRWYRAAFEELKSKQSGLMYAISFDKDTEIDS